MMGKPGITASRTPKRMTPRRVLAFVLIFSPLASPDALESGPSHFSRRIS
jgi:hypothetical protein